MGADRSGTINSNTGLSLLEVLVAVTILGFAFVTLFELFSEGLGRASKAEVYTFALISARSIMDETLAKDPIEENMDFDSLDDGYDYMVDVKRIEDDNEDSKTIVFNVIVDVGWGTSGKVSLVSRKTIYDEEEEIP